MTYQRVYPRKLRAPNNRLIIQASAIPIYSSAPFSLTNIPVPVPQKQNKADHPSQPQQIPEYLPNLSLPMQLLHPHQRNSVEDVLARITLGAGVVGNL